MYRSLRRAAAALLLAGGAAGTAAGAADRPNIVLIYADDLGYGDIGCYGATRVKTPAVDRVAAQGLRFTDAHSSAATCTPSRYSLLTGEYAWRQKGTGILPGDAALIIDPRRPTLPSLLRQAGYATGAVGKWHLGLGSGPIDWNGEIRPGPLEIGFDTSFILPATGDRTPCVYIEDHRVVGLDPKDPIRVNYRERVGDDPTGREHPELLKMRTSRGHDDTIVNGISRIGFMTGGKTARWIDEDMADVLTGKAVAFMEKNKDRKFFLYFATHDIHVPRVPHARYRGTSGCGVRGDVIQQFDGCVAAVTAALDRLGIADRTLLIVTSDNGPVLDDGYADGAVEDLHGHVPAGPLRGGKYDIWEGGTRVPFIVRWPGRVKPGVSDALVCQVDLLASLSALAEQDRAGAGPNSVDTLSAFLGDSPRGREDLVEHAASKLAMRSGTWKYVSPIPPDNVRKSKAAEGGEASPPPGQLYNLTDDLGETKDVAGRNPDVVRRVEDRLRAERAKGTGGEAGPGR